MPYTTPPCCAHPPREEAQDESGLHKIPTCGHLFHKACLNQWLSQRSSCPVCRGLAQQHYWCRYLGYTEVRPWSYPEGFPFPTVRAEDAEASKGYQILRARREEA
jgi:hypothetical protein